MCASKLISQKIIVIHLKQHAKPINARKDKKVSKISDFLNNNFCTFCNNNFYMRLIVKYNVNK